MANTSNSPIAGEAAEMSKVSKIKHDWYQTESHVIITILAKNTKEENVNVEFGGEDVSIIF
jgi:suppressor of G2 allele of SKP1